MSSQKPLVWRLVILVLLTTLCCPFATGEPGPSPINSGSGKWWREWDDEEDTSLAADEINITTAEGHTASLPCRVLHLHDKTVSWIRTQDLTVLAVDRLTVTTDTRFSVKHPQETGDWILEIRGALLSDSGTYDCQVNTYPKKSTRVNLRIISQEDADVFLEMPASDSIVPKMPAEAFPTSHYYRQQEHHRPSPDSVPHAITLRLHGRGWAEVRAGKTLGLTCEATGDSLHEAHASSRAPDSPLIEWTLDEVPVTMIFDKEKVEVYEDWRSGNVLSQLTLFDLVVEDSGSFACHAPHAVTQTIPVTILHPGAKPSYHRDIEKHARKGVLDSRLLFPSKPLVDPHPQQSDAAAQAPSLTGGSTAHSRAKSCSSHRAVLISGAVMLAIMIINCAVCVAMYWKSH